MDAYDRDDCEGSGSSSDVSDLRLELENELYSIIHYSGVNNERTEALAGKYSIEGEGNELRITKKIIPAVEGKEDEGVVDTPTVITGDPHVSGSITADVVDMESEIHSSSYPFRAPACGYQSGGTGKRGFKRPQVGSRKQTKRFYELVEQMEEEEKLTCNQKKRNKKKGKAPRGRGGNVEFLGEVPVIVTISDDEGISSINKNKFCHKPLVESERNDDLVINTTKSPTVIIVSDSDEESTNFAWKKVVSPKTWTKAMKKYYNAPSKHLTAFDCHSIISKMREEGCNEWWINDLDRYPSGRGGARCLRCRGKGHKSWACPSIHRNCHMCSLSGHTESYCPDRMCLNCGERSAVYLTMCDNCTAGTMNKCSICQVEGHWEDTCPDIWRRYHNTVAGGVHVIGSQSETTSDVTPQKVLQCCNCACRGHSFEECHAPYWSMYPVTPSSVINYNGEQNVSKRIRFYMSPSVIESQVDLLYELVIRNKQPGGQLEAFIGSRKRREEARFLDARGTLREILGLRTDLYQRSLWPTLTSKWLRPGRNGVMEMQQWRPHTPGKPPRKKPRKMKKKNKKNQIVSISVL